MMTSPEAFAVDMTAKEAALKVNVAGRQRMLTQRLAKAACLMAQDINASASFDQMTQAYTLFVRSDSALRDGDDSMGLRREESPKVLDALAAIDPHWVAYKSIVENGIDAALIESSALEAMDDAGLQVLKYMNIAVFKTARAYATLSEAVPLGLTITVDIAGRQRMLTQKAVKEACLMRVAADPSVHAARLAETVQLFDSSLTALQDGFADVGIIAPPTSEIGRKLRDVADLWKPVKAILDRAARGEKLSNEQLSLLARESELLLRTMNEAVDMY